MSKILLINCSYRKKHTYKLLKDISNIFESDQLELINLKDYDIKHCLGCEHCLEKGPCVHHDDGEILFQKIINADGIILGTPVYLRQMPGQLKTLFDRGCSWYHHTPVAGKPIFFATTTQATGSKQTLAYLKDLSLQWGMIYAGHISKNLFNSDKPINKKIFNKFIYYLNPLNLKNYRPSYKHIYEFNTQKVLAKEILPLDKVYWEKHNYFNMPYFFKCRINLFKRLFGYSYYKFLHMIISKHKTSS